MYSLRQGVPKFYQLKYFLFQLDLNKNVNMNETPRYVLVPGGAGYIGSHTVIELQKEGFVPVIIDNCKYEGKVSFSITYKNYMCKINPFFHLK